MSIATLINTDSKTTANKWIVADAAIEVLAGTPIDHFKECAILAREAGSAEYYDRIELVAERLIEAKLAGKGISFAMEGTTVSRKFFNEAAKVLAKDSAFVAAAAAMVEYHAYRCPECGCDRFGCHC